MSKTKEVKIDKLTKAQEERIPYYLDKYLKIGLNVTPCDRQAAEQAVLDCYQNLDYAKPKQFFWFDNPFDAAEFAARVAHPNSTGLNNISNHKPTRAEIADQAGKASYGSFESYWVAFYDFIVSELPVPNNPLVDIVKRIVQNCGIFWTFEECVIMSEKPVAIHMLDNKLHNPNGLALQYKDGKGIYAIDGIAYNTLMEMKMVAKFENKKKD